MTNPFVLPVAELIRGGSVMPEQRRLVGPSPSRIGPEMIAIAEGEEVTVDATLTPLGGAILVDADITATLTGECVRCLRTLRPETTLHISQVFAVDEDFVDGGEEDEEDGSVDDVPLIERDEINLEQTVTDEAGLSLPFNPTCEGGCPQDGTDVPAPDGEVDEDGNIIGGEDPRVDPRWAGLEKFL